LKHLVLIDFVCKESAVYYAAGSFYESDNADRVKELDKIGFIKAEALEAKEEKKTVKRTRKKASE